MPIGEKKKKDRDIADWAQAKNNCISLKSQADILEKSKQLQVNISIPAAHSTTDETLRHLRPQLTPLHCAHLETSARIPLWWMQRQSPTSLRGGWGPWLWHWAHLDCWCHIWSNSLHSNAQPEASSLSPFFLLTAHIHFCYVSIAINIQSLGTNF